MLKGPSPNPARKLTAARLPRPHPSPAGISPNTIMYNTAISALGKALRPEEAEALFAEMPAPDAVSFGVNKGRERPPVQMRCWLWGMVWMSSAADISNRPSPLLPTTAAPSGVVRDADCCLWHERPGRQGRGRV